MARHVFGFSALVSLLLPFGFSISTAAAQQLIPPQNDAAGPTDDAPAPPTATDAQRARAARRQSKAGTDRDRATDRLLRKTAVQPPIAGVIHLGRLLCRDRQERGHDEIYFLTAGRRTPAFSEFRLDDEGPERTVHNQDLFQQTLAPGQETTTTIEVWESDGGGKRDDLIGSLRVTLVNVDGQIHASWQPGDFARGLPPTSPAAERFELTGHGADYEVELTALAATPEPPKPVATAPAAPATRVVETVVVPPPPPGPSVRVVIPRRRYYPPRRRYYPPRRGIHIRW